MKASYFAFLSLSLQELSLRPMVACLELIDDFLHEVWAAIASEGCVVEAIQLLVVLYGGAHRITYVMSLLSIAEVVVFADKHSDWNLINRVKRNERSLIIAKLVGW